MDTSTRTPQPIRHLLSGAKKLVAASLLMLALPLQAVTVDISDIPLYIGGQTKPNIMLDLDDSGSMHWEILPDYNIYSYYMFPRASGVYGTSDYTNYVPSFGYTAGNEYGVAMRSSSINKNYYNPALTYEPWKYYDNSSYPDASITCAYHNPAKTSAGCRDLTTTNTETASWDTCDQAANLSGATCSTTTQSRSFWPAVYYTYSGASTDLTSADVWTLGNYTEVVIKDPASGGSNSYTGSADRTDCAAAPTCTYAEEIQNFANWYTYYRSRILTARAGAGTAFAQLSEPTTSTAAARVGFATINKSTENIDGVNTQSIVTGVRPFVSTDRQNFFTQLYTRDLPLGSTPLRRSLDDIGQYYSRTDAKGPWNESPGTAGGNDISCRQSYTIMVTDGYWNSSSANTTGATLNTDGTGGPTNTGPDNKSYTYSAVTPFTDSYSGTLADVAMYYWKNDLRAGSTTALTNDVPTNVLDPAFWQHMVTFGVSLGLTGTISEADAFDAIDTGATITWPDPTTADEHKLDDLLHAAVNSRGFFSSASDPKELTDGLTKAINNVTGRTSSASAIATNSTRLDANTFIYQAKYDSADWSGRLLAYKINTDGSVGAQQWDGATGIPAAASRDIFTYDGTSGVEFLWSNLTTAQQTALGSTDVLNYIRGDQSKEVKNGGSYRNRTYLLGDIVNSDPWFVGAANFGYSLLDETEGNTYIDFIGSTSYKNRTRAVYVGANDGMLHAFNAITGDELFSYVPASVYSNLSGLTSPTYTHKFYVDGSPRAGDAYIDVGSGKEWRTVLAGATGAGGKSIFALDVTYPSTFTASDVLWEFTDAELGYTIGQPTIVRLANGQWGAVFGNGYNSTSQTARVFIVNVETGALIAELDTQVGDSTNPNGMATPVVVDVDGDRIADLIYAGDLQGNLWRFDIDNSNAGQWGSPYKSGNKPDPLFTAVGPNGEVQPITSKPQVKSHPDGGLMVYVGTGKYFEVGDNIVPTATTPDVMSIYGIHDVGAVVARADLLQQQIFYEATGTFTHPTSGDTYDWDIRLVTQNGITSESGWYIDLISPANGEEGERVVAPALVWNDRVIFTTLIPNEDPCTWGGTSWLMEVDPDTGGRLNFSVFDLNQDGSFSDAEYVTVTDPNDPSKTITIPVTGKKSKEGITKTPGVICADTACYKYGSGSSGDVEVTANKGTVNSGRQSWQQLK